MIRMAGSTVRFGLRLDVGFKTRFTSALSQN